VSSLPPLLSAAAGGKREHWKPCIARASNNERRQNWGKIAR
jgi:hypothetical protein